MFVQRDRAWRRFQAVKQGERQVRIAVSMNGSGWIKTVGYYAKRHALGCNCSTKSRGRPKVGRGPCHYYNKDPIILLRQEDRRLAKIR